MTPLLFLLACAPRTGGLAARTPTAEQVFDRHLAAIVLDPAQAATYTSMHATLDMSIPSMGLAGGGDLWMQSPDRLLLQVDLPGLGLTEQATDGVHAWVIDSSLGPRILQGLAAAEVHYAAHFAGDQDYATRYSRLELVGETPFLDRPCWELFAATPEGLERSFLFDQDSGRMVGIRGLTHTDMGGVQTVSELLDYQAYGALMQPQRTVVRMMGIEQVLTTGTVTWNPGELPSFAPPPEIRALLEELGG